MMAGNADKFPELLRAGTWNCRYTANYSNSTDTKSKGRIIEYCKKLNCDVVAIQEFNHHEIEKETKDGYTIIFIERDPERIVIKCGGSSSKGDKKMKNKREKNPDRGLAFVVKNETTIKAKYLPKKHSSRIASLKFEFDKVGIQLFNCYGPVCDTSNSSKEYSEVFFRELKDISEIERQADPERIQIFCGDFNAFPEDAENSKYIPWVNRHVHNTKSMNIHGPVLYWFLYSTGVYHTGSRFVGINGKWTRKGTGRRETKTEIDAFLSNRTDLVVDVDTAEEQGGSDHRMVISVWHISKKRENFIKKIEVIEKWSRTQFNNSCISQTDEEDEEYLKNLVYFMFLPFGTVELSRNWTFRASAIKNEVIEAISEHLRQSYPRNTILPGSERTNKMVSRIVTEMGTFGIKRISETLESLMDVPEDCKIAIAQLKSKQIFPKAISWFGSIYSELLIKMTDESAGNEILAEMLRLQETRKNELRKKSIENLITLTLLIEAFHTAQQSLHFIIFEYQQPFDHLNISNVIRSIVSPEIPEKLQKVFSQLPAKMKLTVENKEFKTNGIHFGDCAYHVLLASMLSRITKAISPDGTKPINSKMKHAWGIDINGQKLSRLQWNNVVTLVDHNIKNLESHYSHLLGMSNQYGLIINDDKTKVISNQKDLVGKIARFGEKDIRIVSAAEFRCSYYSHKETKITDVLSNVRIHRDRACESFTLPKSYRPRNKKNFFDKWVGSLFYNCETWTPTDKEIYDLQDHVNKFWDELNLTGDKFNVQQHIIERKMSWLETIKEGILKFLLDGLTPAEGNVEIVRIHEKWNNGIVGTTP